MYTTTRLIAPILTLVLIALAVPASAQDKVLRVVQNGNLTILDPIWTTAYVTRNHGYLIYDTLFARDENNVVKPQMVESYEVSADKTMWTFKLRDGLEWHDGNPVTSADCIPSIRRWGARDAMGMKLMSFMKELTALQGGRVVGIASAYVRIGHRSRSTCEQESLTSLVVGKSLRRTHDSVFVRHGYSSPGHVGAPGGPLDLYRPAHLLFRNRQR